MILGKVLGDIKERGGTYSKQDLQPYEKGWRAELEETLYRNWMAKNKLVTLSDDDFDKIIATLSTSGIGKLSVHEILKVIKERHPELVAKFADMI